ncbi:MAG: hypothetical protein U0168_07285 [Nannocystaceae bacterium]
MLAARAWAEADPEHAPVLLLALADALAAQGDPLAARAYASKRSALPFVGGEHATPPAAELAGDRAVLNVARSQHRSARQAERRA